MKYLFLIIFAISTPVLFAQELAKFSIQIEEERIDAPVSISLNGINYNTDKGNLILYEITKTEEILIPSQIETGHSAKLWFILKGISEKNSERKFVLKQEKKQAFRISNVSLKKDDNDLSLLVNEKPILSYRFATTFPPNGVDSLYKRSGFIHPVYSPNGEVLTRIQPPDHYHHYGIWGPWTKTHIDEREVDFWNLAKGQGTVKFSGFIS